jgi:hypothetical protein
VRGGLARSLAPLAAIAAVVLAVWPVPGGCDVIYGYKDEQGVLNLTNKRTDARFRPVFFFNVPRNCDRGLLSVAISRSARNHGVDPRLITAMIEVESGFSLTAVSPKGAMGPMQLMPGTARDMGLKDPFDPSGNVEAGTRYFKEMLNRFGDATLALAAYNAGPARVEACKGVPNIKETKDYVVKVMGKYRGEIPSSRSTRQ